jgi:hypothetical protein
MELQLVQIQHKILEVREQKVMFDFDLATLYGIETKRLKEAVRRNIERFAGDDFMFEISGQEWEILRSQIATSSWGGTRYQPFAFTELTEQKKTCRQAAQSGGLYCDCPSVCSG